MLACIGLYGKRGRSLAANMTLLSGLLVWVTGKHLLPEWIPHPYMTSLFAALTAFVVGDLIESLQISSGRPPALRPTWHPHPSTALRMRERSPHW